MSEVLLLNPSPRRKRRKNPSANQRRFARAARARSVGANPKRRRSRRSNPVAAPVVRSLAANPRRRRRSARRRNPVALRSYRSKRRSNPAGLPTVNTIMATIKEGATMGVGAIGIDYVYSFAERYLPASMQNTPGVLGVGTVVKAAATVAIGTGLSRLTKGLSRKAALGALVIQANDIARALLPSLGLSGRGRMGYASPAAIANGVPRAGLAGGRMGMYVPGGPQAGMLNRYTAPGVTPLLNGRGGNARVREGAVR